MDESALRALIATLDARRSSFHWWLDLFTAFVVAGVALEVIFVVWEYVDELHDFKRGIIRPPDRPSRLKFFLGLLGAALVAVGVSGELYEGARIETIETSIRKANDDLYLILSKQAGDAAISARIAHDEADAVKGIADAAKRDAEGALVKAKAAEKKLAWRDLTPQQQTEIASAVRKFGPKKYSLIVWGNTPEITRLAAQIFNTLTQVNWTLDGWGFAMAGSTNGVLVSTEKEAPTDVAAAADALVMAFNAKGIVAAKGYQTYLGHGRLTRPRSETGARSPGHSGQADGF